MSDHARKRPRLTAPISTSTSQPASASSYLIPHSPAPSPLHASSPSPSCPSSPPPPASSTSSSSSSAFSVSAIGRAMRRDRPDCVSRIGSGAPVYMSAVLEFITHELIDAAAQQAKKQQLQQHQQHQLSKSRHADTPLSHNVAEDTKGHTAGGEAGAHSEATVDAGLTGSAVNGAEDSGDWLAGDTTITPSHLAAVFNDNEDWAAVMREFTFDTPLTPPSPPRVTSPPHVHSDASSIAQLPPLHPHTDVPVTLPAPVVDVSPSASSPGQSDPPSSDNDSSPIKPSPPTAFICRHVSNSDTSSLLKADQPSVTPTYTTAKQSTRVRERGTKHSRPTLKASRGWAGGRAGDAVSQYKPVVQRDKDGRLCVNNPYA